MSRKLRKNVGVIGLGIIGSRVAAGLRAAGYQAYVWNRTAKPAPNFLGSPAEVADAAEIIQIFVSDSAALFEVIEAMGDSLTARHIIVCCATIGPEAVLEAAQIVETKGAQFLDAPFTGSKLAAEKRQLVYYIGGAEHTFLKVKPVLEATSKSIVRIGEVGHAATVKVVTNMISAVTTQVLAESLSIVQKAGLEPEVLAAAIEQNACRSGVIDLKLPKMITGDYDPHFSLKHMFKDVQLGIHMANALDVEIPATTVTAGVMYGAINQGWADADFSVLFRNYAPPEANDDFPALPISSGLKEETAGTEETSASMEPAKPESAVEAQPANIGDRSIPESMAETPVAASKTAPADRDSDSSANAGDDLTSEDAEPAVAIVESVEPITNSRDNEEAPSSKSIPKDSPAPPPGEEKKGPETNQQGMDVEGSAPANLDADNPDRPMESEAEPSARPDNFVRRWFVARTGG